MCILIKEKAKYLISLKRKLTETKNSSHIFKKSFCQKKTEKTCLFLKNSVILYKNKEKEKKNLLSFLAHALKFLVFSNKKYFENLA